MSVNKFIFILFFFTLLSSCKSQIDLTKTPIGLINNVSYNNPAFNNSNAGNGFLVSYNQQVYAITAKHILNIAKTPKMQFVDFEGELSAWKMQPKNDSTKVVLLDKLLSHNRTDSLTWSFLDSNWDTYNDWLVFSIKENNSNNRPLTFRKKPLVAGEKLFIVGWSYKDETGAQRVYEYKYGKADGIYHEIIQVKGPESLGGLSGSPVVDEQGAVIGLVTSGWEDEDTKEIIVAATAMEGVLNFLKGMNE